MIIGICNIIRQLINNNRAWQYFLLIEVQIGLWQRSSDGVSSLWVGVKFKWTLKSITKLTSSGNNYSNCLFICLCFGFFSHHLCSVCLLASNINGSHKVGRVWDAGCVCASGHRGSVCYLLFTIVIQLTVCVGVCVYMCVWWVCVCLVSLCVPGEFVCVCVCVWTASLGAWAHVKC